MRAQSNYSDIYNALAGDSKILENQNVSRIFGQDSVIGENQNLISVSKDNQSRFAFDQDISITGDADMNVSLVKNDSLMHKNNR